MWLIGDLDELANDWLGQLYGAIGDWNPFGFKNWEN
jgi:hypothetical protein